MRRYSVPAKSYKKKYYWCVLFTIAGGALVSTVAFNVMGRVVGFDQITPLDLAPGFAIGSISGGLISYYVIRGRILLLQQVEREQQHIKSLMNATYSLEASQATMARFLSKISTTAHSGLDTIKSIAELIDPKAHEISSQLQLTSAAKTIASTAEDLMMSLDTAIKYTLLEENKLKLAETTFDICQTLETCIEYIQTTPDYNQHDIVYKKPPENLFLRADEELTKIVIINILSNALKFSKPFSKVAVSAEQSELEGVNISFHDEGIGIPDDKIKAALTPFYKIDQKDNLNTGGFGLGLHLCDQIMRLHDGLLHISSPPKVGTIVTLSFPKKRLV